MPSNEIRDRETVIAQIAESEEETARLREHLKEIAEGNAFRGSDRCARFLTHMVEQAVAGRFDSLKERVIGVEVFGRSPDYDTSEDAIVRVTATDVRKRLQQYYGSRGNGSRFQIRLPVGSYVPEIACESPKHIVRSHTEPYVHGVANPETARSHAAQGEIAVASVGNIESSPSRWRAIAFLFGAIAVLFAALSLVLWVNRSKTSSHANVAAISVLPWSVLFNSPGTTHLITSDVDFVRIQRLIGKRIFVSDYANRNYLPQPNALQPEDKSYLMQGDKSSTQDAQIVASIAELAGVSGHRIDVEGARDIKFSDLETGDNFIFLGSPYSDPWSSVFNDQLDFQFAAGGDGGMGAEAIRNVRPRPNEQRIYTATTSGGGTGESYAIVALVGNHSQYGHVLLLAGISGEGTLAAGRLVTDLPRLSAALKQCGISSSSPLKHFEMLLRVKLMAGSPSEYEVVACHNLQESFAR